MIIKTLIFDFDIYIVQKLAPAWTWLIYSKFFILIGLVATIWIFTKNKHIVWWSLYIMFYPLILTGKLLFYLFKTRNWVLILGTANVVVSFVKSFKYRCITFAFSAISIALITFSHSIILLYAAIMCLMLMLSLTFIRNFYYAFRPSVLYQAHSHFVTVMLDYGKKSWGPGADTASLTVAQMNKGQLDTWILNLQFSVIANRFCYFLSSKLREYQKSNVTVAADIIRVFFLGLVTVFVFAFVNYGVYKAMPTAFKADADQKFFMFLYYSSSNLLDRSIFEIVPAAILSRLLAVLEMVFSFSLIAILISLLISVKNRRDSEEIDSTIQALRRHGADMEGFINDKYRMTVQGAILELERLKGAFIKVIYYFGQDIENDSFK